MSIWNKFRSDDRVIRWRELRIRLTALEKDEQLKAIAEFFFSVPVSSRAIDYYTPDTWPTPWETLHNDEFCTSTISILIYHTLQLCNYSDDVKLVLVDDTADRYLLPVIDNRYILNYELGQISSWQQIKSKTKIIERFDNSSIPQYK